MSALCGGNFWALNSENLGSVSQEMVFPAGETAAAAASKREAVKMGENLTVASTVTKREQISNAVVRLSFLFYLKASLSCSIRAKLDFEF